MPSSAAPSRGATSLCCTHPKDRLNSPSPLPPRHTLSTHVGNGMSIDDRLFTAATLPEDHPHALCFPNRRVRPTSAIMNIIKSPPKLREKMLERLRRASIKNFQTCEQEAKDAQLVSCGDPDGFEDGISKDGAKQNTELRGGQGRDRANTNIAQVAEAVAFRWPVSFLDDHGNDPILSKAVSSPDLLDMYLRSQSTFRRSRSAAVLGEGLRVPRVRKSELTGTLEEEGPGLLVLDGYLQASEQLRDIVAGRSEHGTSEHIRLSTQASDVHLQSMDISEQLRSMSQLSGSVDDEDAAPEPWIFHRRNISHSATSVGSGRLRSHSRNPSSLTAEICEKPQTPRQIQSAAVGDASSSIYSRPYSPDAATIDTNADGRPWEIQYNIGAIQDDWPLQTMKPEGVDMQPTQRSTCSTPSTVLVSNTIPLTPEDTRADQRSPTIHVVRNRSGDHSTHMTPNRSTGIGKGSSSTLNSKRSRFFERFSPPKKTVKKRRSIFKFLRPGSRRQDRSVSTPILQHSPVKLWNMCDGLHDDHEVLTVQYELTDYPKRNMSTTNEELKSGEPQSVHQLTLPFVARNERRPSLADYERSLTARSDDRRKPSAIDLLKLRDIQDEERRESLSARQGRTRTAMMDQDSSPLMAQALMKHQAEKAMFSSESKRRESLLTPDNLPLQHPVFGPLSAGTFPGIRVYNEGLDTSDNDRPISHRGSPGQLFLEPEYGPTAESSKSPRSRSASEISPLLLSPVGTKESSPKVSKTDRIGTSLRSWCRFPSHTRVDRCGSAGQTDAVVSRDFAVDSNAHAYELVATDSNTSKVPNNVEGKRSRRSFIRRRPISFGTITRYYRNLFTSSGFKGQNRRTSVNVGGRLQYPELEMLPPSTGTTTEQHHFKNIHEHLKKVEQHIADDLERLFHHREDGVSDKVPAIRSDDSSIEAESSKAAQERSQALWPPAHDRRDSAIDLDDTHLPDIHPAPSISGNASFLPSISVPIGEHKGKDTVQAKQEPSRPPPDPALTFDGSTAAPILTVPKAPNSSPSKAELFSAEYQTCLSRPPPRHPTSTTSAIAAIPSSAPSTNPERPLTPCPSPPNHNPTEPSHHLTISRFQARATNSIRRNPAKPHDTGSQSRRGTPYPGFGLPTVRVRRYPSVTVIDDLRGHTRSVSLVSNAGVTTMGAAGQVPGKIGGSLRGSGVREGGGERDWNQDRDRNEGERVGCGDGVERESTRDLLLLVQRREREERERLVRGFEE